MVSAFYAYHGNGNSIILVKMNFSAITYAAFVSNYFLCLLQILELTISRSLVRLIQQLVDEDGSVKDSAVCPHFDEQT